MKFSVLMSVYNKAITEEIHQSLCSIINQTLIPDEIVIVKDGTLSHELAKELDCWKKKYPDMITIVTLKVNVGIGLALRKGIHYCRNEIVARMDADDIAHPDRFEKQINFLKNHKEISVIGSWIGEFETNPSEIKTIRKVPQYNPEIIQYARFRNPLNHMTVVFKKRDILEVGNYQDINGFEDYYLWTRLLKHGKKMYNLQEILVDARINYQTFERRGGFKYFLNEIKFQLLIFKLKFISPGQYLKNMIIRGSVRLIPGFILRRIYNLYAR